MAKKEMGQMYVPDEQPGGLGYVTDEQPGGLGYVTEEKGMYVPEKTRLAPKKSAEEFNLYKTVKKAAEKEGMKKGGSVSSASKRADGCCVRGKTRA